jgi:hypothetical protein
MFSITNSPSGNSISFEVAKSVKQVGESIIKVLGLIAKIVSLPFECIAEIYEKYEDKCSARKNLKVMIYLAKEGRTDWHNYKNREKAVSDLFKKYPDFETIFASEIKTLKAAKITVVPVSVS